VLSAEVHLDDATGALSRIVDSVVAAGAGPLGRPKVDILRLVRPELEHLLPEDAHERCNGRAVVFLTDISRRPWSPVALSHWETRESLIESVLVSSYIPGLTSRRSPCGSSGLSSFGSSSALSSTAGLSSPTPPPAAAPPLRGPLQGVRAAAAKAQPLRRLVGGALIDGGFKTNFPLHPTADRTVRVSPFSGELDICPEVRGRPPRRVLLPSKVRIDVTRANASAVRATLWPPRDGGWLQDVLAQGFDDACRWLRREQQQPRV